KSGVVGVQILLHDGQVVRQAVFLQHTQIFLPGAVGHAVHDPVSLAGVHVGGQVGLQLGNGLGVLVAHKDVGENIVFVHLGGVDLLDPIQTVLGIVGAGDIDVVVVVQDGQ